jgi:ketosteroid isomerase-like protein
MASTPARKFYDEQLDYLYKKDVDGLIDNHYNEDALLISFDATVRGRQALKEHFRRYLQMLGDLKVKSTDKFTETGDTIFFEATVNASNLGDTRVYDAFVLRNGKISYHFTGVMEG